MIYTILNTGTLVPSVHSAATPEEAVGIVRRMLNDAKYEVALPEYDQVRIIREAGYPHIIIYKEEQK